MNDIEKRFYDAFKLLANNNEKIYDQVVIGIYVADFVIYPDAFIPSVIEIDGHDFHKTKEQRYNDYKKERYYMSQGYSVIRFMGTEVFNNAMGCAREAMQLSCEFSERYMTAYDDGYQNGLLMGKQNVIGCGSDG